MNNKKHEIQPEIAKVFDKTPIYGAKKVHQQLLENGVKSSLNTVATYRKELGLKAILAVNQVTTTVPNKQHEKYSYTHANQVCRTDITYIKVKSAMV